MNPASLVIVRIISKVKAATGSQNACCEPFDITGRIDSNTIRWIKQFCIGYYIVAAHGHSENGHVIIMMSMEWESKIRAK